MARGSFQSGWYWSNDVEIRLNVSDEQPPKIEVLGRDNARIHEHSLPAEARGQILKTALNEGFFFPSEFKPDEEERPYFLEPALPPMTDLGFLSGTAEMRLWIESDARPCMSAIYVAANFALVTSLRYPSKPDRALLLDLFRFLHDPPPVIERVPDPDPDAEFNRLFEPYDGSLLFYFREGFFRSLDERGRGSILRSRDDAAVYFARRQGGTSRVAMFADAAPRLPASASRSSGAGARLLRSWEHEPSSSESGASLAAWLGRAGAGGLATGPGGFDAVESPHLVRFDGQFGSRRAGPGRK